MLDLQWHCFDENRHKLFFLSLDTIVFRGNPSLIKGEKYITPRMTSV